MWKKEWVAMLLAGGQGNRLGTLTKDIAKPAVPFAGKYRIIDFSLSNCTNSGIDTVGVLTQYKPAVLNSHIGIGSAWDLDAYYGGVRILQPYTNEKGTARWYKGTASSVFENMDFIEHFDPEYVLIISGDHIYKMDYSKMLKFHKENDADVTISTIEVSKEEASRFGVLSIDSLGRITDFVEKPQNPTSNLASMGIYIFDWKILKASLINDEKNPESTNDFGKDIIPMLLEEGKRIFAYKFKGYWKDVGTIESYYKANMDLLSDKKELDIFQDKEWRIFSNDLVLPPQYIGEKARISNSFISDGCAVFGDVQNSILSPGVIIGEGASVRNSIILPGAEVKPGAFVEKAIIGEKAEVAGYVTVGGNGEEVVVLEEAKVV